MTCGELCHATRCLKALDYNSRSRIIYARLNTRDTSTEYTHIFKATNTESLKTKILIISTYNSD